MRRLVEGELRKVAHRRPEVLRRALDRCLEDAADHDNPMHRMACLTFIADRLDGKARQSIDVSGDGPREVSMADLVRLVMQARSIDADDAVQHQSPALANTVPVEG